MLEGIWLVLGFVYLIMTFFAYALVKPEHKMSVLSGWWCFNKSYFNPRHYSFVLVGKVFMFGTLLCAVSYLAGGNY